MTISARLEPRQLHPEVEMERFMTHLGEEGAMVSFVGIARPRREDGQPVERLFLDHYPGLTERSLERIAADAAARFGLRHILVVHRCGELVPGDPIVLAAAASIHRRAAFEAADYLMDRLKTEAVFWKREDGKDGAVWIEPTDKDRADRARWE